MVVFTNCDEPLDSTFNLSAKMEKVRIAASPN